MSDNEFLLGLESLIFVDDGIDDIGIEKEVTIGKWICCRKQRYIANFYC